MRIAWNKGLTKETDERVKKYSYLGKDKKSKSHIGLKNSLETRRKISNALKGRNITWNKKISNTLKIKYKNGDIIMPKGNESFNFKGDKACYSAFHLRVEKIRGKPKECEVCGNKNKDIRYEWANISGRYENILDYKRMCKKCHNIFDKSR